MTAMYIHEHFNRFYGWVQPQSRQVEASRPELGASVAEAGADV